MKSTHRVIITLKPDQISAAPNDEYRLFVCDVSDNRHGDGNLHPLRKAIEGQNNRLLAAFMHELRTRDISNWKPQEAARKLSGATLAPQNVRALDPPLVWLSETLECTTKNGDPAKIDLSPGTWSLRRERSEMLASYVTWAERSRVHRSGDYTSREAFHRTIRKFLNQRTFPGAPLERKSGPTRYWFMPTRKEMKEGLTRWLGGGVVDDSCRRPGRTRARLDSGRHGPV
jgi:hypothetical protein